MPDASLVPLAGAMPAGSLATDPGSEWLAIERWAGEIRIERTETNEMDTPSGRARHDIQVSARASVLLRVWQVDEFQPVASWEDREATAQGEWWERRESVSRIPGQEWEGRAFGEVTGSGSAPASAFLVIDAGAGTYNVNFGAAEIPVTEATWEEWPPEALEPMRALCDETGILCPVLEAMERQETEGTRSFPNPTATDIPLPATPGSVLQGSAEVRPGLRLSWSLRPDDCAAVERVALDVDVGRELVFDRSLPSGARTTNLSSPVPQVIDGTPVEGVVEWTIPEVEGSELTVQPRDPRARSWIVEVTYEGMPEDNDEFGHREVTAEFIPSTPCIEAEGPVERETELRFDRDAEGNPDGKVPNWIYYWIQTPAGHGLGLHTDLVYDPECDDPQDARGYTTFGYHVWLPSEAHPIYICPNARLEWDNRVIGRITYGIDTFGAIVAHELEHRRQYHEWWADFYDEWYGRDEYEERKRAIDADGDGIPDALERALGLNPTRFDTHRLKMSDSEYLARLAEARWRIGAADHVDWSVASGPTP
jgi:hypothetical protein